MHRKQRRSVGASQNRLCRLPTASRSACRPIAAIELERINAANLGCGRLCTDKNIPLTRAHAVVNAYHNSLYTTTAITLIARNKFSRNLRIWKDCNVMSGLNHIQKVRLLYKTILRLHRGLPKELQELGQTYVRDEFRRHKNCNPKEAQIFMQEWSRYTLTLSEQLLKNAKSNIGFGKHLDVQEGVLDSFTDDQILQLYNMLKETTGIQDQTVESELNSKK